jgi:hypothetical protein
MNTKQTMAGNTRLIAVVIPILVILFPLGYSTAYHVFVPSSSDAEPFLERTAEEHTNCVRDTVYMRLHHWQFLREIREEVVRYGQRGDVGLRTCKECHKSRARFCNKCHDAVSMTPDCYGCHYYP